MKVRKLWKSFLLMMEQYKIFVAKTILVLIIMLSKKKVFGYNNDQTFFQK